MNSTFNLDELIIWRDSWDKKFISLGSIFNLQIDSKINKIFMILNYNLPRRLKSSWKI